MHLELPAHGKLHAYSETITEPTPEFAELEKPDRLTEPKEQSRYC